MNNNLNVKLYIPFTKTDSEERIVEGYASSEALDSQGEIIKSSAIEKALPEYMKFANIREMHQRSAVGKAISAVMDNKKKALYLTSKVIDPTAWEKVKEGVYNGYSIGGQVVKRIGNVIHEIKLHEISLVDRPANPDAVFALYKSDEAEKYNEAEVVASGEIDNEDTGSDLPGKVYLAAEILRIAQQICYLYEYYDMKGKDTSKLEASIKLLTEIANGALVGDSADKAAAIEVLDLTKEKIEAKQAEKKAKSEAITKRAEANTATPNTASNIWVNDYFAQARKVI